MDFNRRQFFKNIVSVAGTSLVAEKLAGQILSRKDGFTNIDWKQIASQFLVSQDKIYLNNGTLGPSPKQVIEAVLYKMNLINSTGNYGDSDACRKKLGTFIGVNDYELAMTHNTTEVIYILCNGFQLKKGQRILLTNHEHAGGAVPWLNLAKQQNLNIDIVELASTPMETFERIKKKVTSKTKVIALPHIACTTGHLLPIEEVATWAKSQDIKFIVDGAHGAGLIPLNLGQTNIDYYAGCCHKWMCGPKGTGFLFVRKSALETLTPKFVGAGSDSGWKTNGVDQPLIEKFAPSTIRFQYGTQNTALWYGIESSIDFIESIGIENINKHSNYLCNLFKKGIQELPQYDLLTPLDKDASAGMVTIRHKSIGYKEINAKLTKEKIRARVVPEHDLDALRFSFHMYNNADQVEFVLSQLKSI